MFFFFLVLKFARGIKNTLALKKVLCMEQISSWWVAKQLDFLLGLSEDTVVNQSGSLCMAY